MAAAAMAVMLAAGPGIAQEAPEPVAQTWTSSEGVMHLVMLPYSFEGTYESDNGRVVAVLAGDTMTGYWGEEASSEECETEMMGTKFWGRIAFTFDDAGQHFDGKWSYCDAEPDQAWTGDLAP
jgi:hypothetical protein